VLTLAEHVLRFPCQTNLLVQTIELFTDPLTFAGTSIVFCCETLFSDYLAVHRHTQAGVVDQQREPSI